MTPAFRNFDLRDIALAIVFFTRLPLPPSDSRGRKLADAIWAAPIAGLLVAIAGGVAYTLSAWLGLAHGPAAALAVATTVLATGCLHEDGLSDVADGFGGGATSGKKLEIMRDSRIGAYGASALVLSVLLRWSALAAFTTPAHVFCALIAAHCASRGFLGLFMHLLPAARADGLSASAGRVSSETATAAAILGAMPLLLLGIGGAVASLVLLILVFLAFRTVCLRQIGGQTGDTVGALQQFGEIATLLVASAWLS